MKRFLKDILLGALFIVCLALTFALGYYVRALTAESLGLTWALPGLKSTESYPLLAQISHLLDQYYIAPVPDAQKLEYGAAHGLVNAIGDPYTVFVEPEPHELETQSLQGEYGGVGMSLAADQAGAIVLTPFAGSPAAKGGILEGDILLAVDTTAITSTMKIDDVVALVRGPVGSSVSFTVRHPSGEVVTLSLTRQTFAIPSVLSRIVTDTVPIGLIAVSRFSDKTPDEVRQAADSLRAKGAMRYILDLRNNGGGILESGVNVAALFLDGGVVMYETQKGQPERVFSAPANSGPLAKVPLAVLVNHGTASAAEIAAGALLDRGRAPLIGQQTYGKGSVQLVFDLPAGASLHVTAYLWYTPTHRALDKNGLPPTLAVEPATDGSDAEIARAITYFQTISNP
jgi:carboxyl-terminal processing protease